MDSWDLLKKIYKEHLGINPIVLDYIATLPILKMAVEGRSIQSIAVALAYDTQYVQQTLSELLQFNGFAQDLDFNARSIYVRHRYNKYAYFSTARMLDCRASKVDLSESFRINSLFDRIERDVAQYDASA